MTDDVPASQILAIYELLYVLLYYSDNEKKKQKKNVLPYTLYTLYTSVRCVNDLYRVDVWLYTSVTL